MTDEQKNTEGKFLESAELTQEQIDQMTPSDPLFDEPVKEGSVITPRDIRNFNYLTSGNATLDGICLTDARVDGKVAPIIAVTSHDRETGMIDIKPLAVLVRKDTDVRPVEEDNQN